MWGQNSWVGTATRYKLYGPRIESLWGQDFSIVPDRPWGPPNLLYNGYRVSFPGGNAAGCSAQVKERADLYLYSSSGTLGSVLRRSLLYITLFNTCKHFRIHYIHTYANPKCVQSVSQQHKRLTLCQHSFLVHLHWIGVSCGISNNNKTAAINYSSTKTLCNKQKSITETHHKGHIEIKNVSKYCYCLPSYEDCPTQWQTRPQIPSTFPSSWPRCSIPPAQTRELSRLPTYVMLGHTTLILTSQSPSMVTLTSWHYYEKFSTYSYFALQLKNSHWTHSLFIWLNKYFTVITSMTEMRGTSSVNADK